MEEGLRRLDQLDKALANVMGLAWVLVRRRGCAISSLDLMYEFVPESLTNKYLLRHLVN